MTRDFKTNRSNAYQHILLESLCAPDTLTIYSDSKSYTTIHDSENEEKLKELKEQLKVEFWRIVGKLTKRQQEVLKLMAQGLTQIEIAKKLKVNQSSVTKSLNGNAEYLKHTKNSNLLEPEKKKKKRKSYGGAKRKLLKIAQTDQTIQDIFKQIAELENEQ